MTPEEIDAIAEATAAKISQGLLRLPDDLRAALADPHYGAGPGFYSSPGLLMSGPNAYFLQAFSRSSGIELQIKRPDGSLCWQAVIA